MARVDRNADDGHADDQLNRKYNNTEEFMIVK